MKMAFSFIFLAEFICMGGAFAEVSHLGKVDLSFNWVDQKGKSEKIASADSVFRLDWKTKKCEIKIKDQYAYCHLDTSHDLVNANGELIMKSMPQAHFDARTIDALMAWMGREDKNAGVLIGTVLRTTHHQRVNGLDLPFYTCGSSTSGSPDCLKNGKDLLLFNAFKNQSYVLRQIEIVDPRLGNRKLVMTFKLHDIEALSGAFQIIGNNGAGNFGRR